jgi:hypothetical protein
LRGKTNTHFCASHAKRMIRTGGEVIAGSPFVVYRCDDIV